ncbi:hypothetical protein D3C76_999970 [compost metagenome]
MNDLQRGLFGELAAEDVQVHAGDPEAMRKLLNRQVFTVVLLHQFDVASQHLLIALVAVARCRLLLAVAADPHHQAGDQRMQQQITRRCAAFVLLVQHPDQGVKCAAITPQVIAAHRCQDRQRRV